MVSRKAIFLCQLSMCLLLGLSGCQAQPAQTPAPASLPAGIPTAPARLPPPTPLAVQPKPVVVLSPVPQTTLYPVETAACTLGNYNPIGFLPDNHRLIARVNQGISILDLNTGLEELFLQPGQEIVAAALSPDGGYLALALADNSIHFYQMAGKQRLYKLAGHTGRINSLKFSSDSSRLVSAGADSWVRIWDVRGHELQAFQPPLWDNTPAEQLAAALSPDNKRVATKAGEDALKLWDIQSKARLLEIKTPYGAFNGTDISFSPDGQYLLWGSGGGPVSLNRLSDGGQVWGGGVYAAAFSPDGSLVAYSDMDDAGHNRVALRSVVENKTAGVLKGQLDGLFWRIIFSPDGQRLAAASDLGTSVWNVNSGSVVLTRSSVCP